MLVQGGLAKLHGLVKRNDLNGSHVTLQHWEDDKGRWAVRISETQECIRVLPTNLVRRAEVPEKMHPGAAATTASTSTSEAAPTTVQPVRLTSAVASQSSARVARLEYLTLLLRQLLFKYGLDRGAKLKSVLDFVETHEGARNHQRDASGIAKTALDLSVRFATSIEDAYIFASYFGVPRDQMSLKQMDQITDAFMHLVDTAVEHTDVIHIPAFLNDREVGELFDAATALWGAEMPKEGAGAGAPSYPHHVQYGAAHSALFLHRDSHFASFCPKLNSKIQTAMRSQPQVQVQCRV